MARGGVSEIEVRIEKCGVSSALKVTHSPPFSPLLFLYFSFPPILETANVWKIVPALMLFPSLAVAFRIFSPALPFPFHYTLPFTLSHIIIRAESRSRLLAEARAARDDTGRELEGLEGGVDDFGFAIGPHSRRRSRVCVKNSSSSSFSLPHGPGGGGESAVGGGGGRVEEGVLASGREAGVCAGGEEEGEGELRARCFE